MKKLIKTISLGLVGAIRSVWRWLTARPSYQFVTLSEQKLRYLPARRFSRAWFGLMAGSLGWGIASAWLWAGVWKLFNDPRDLMIMPALMMAGAILWLFRRGAVALIEIAFGREGTGRGLGGAALVVLLVMVLLRLQAYWYTGHLEYSLPDCIAWVRPGGKVYRVLVLMPLWGAWSMMAVCQFYKPTRRTERSVAAFARGCGPVATAVCMAVPLAMTIGYVGHLGLRAQLTIPAVTIGTAIVGGLVLCRATGALSRRGLLAGNILTQIVFVLVFLAFPFPFQ